MYQLPRLRLAVVLTVLLFVASACETGRSGVVAVANSNFDVHTRAPSESEWQWMRDHYSRLLVWAPYWDSRLQHFDDVLVYENSYGIKASGTLGTEHPDWVMREADGTPTYIDYGCGGPTGCPQLAGDLGNPAFVQYKLDRIASLVARGYPGIMLDDVNMLERWSDRNGNTVTPIDPSTGQPITLADWRKDMADYLTLIRTTFPNLEITHNVIWFSDSPGFDDPQITRQIAAADYLALERGANDGGLVAGSGKFGFQTFLRYIDHAHDQGTAVMLIESTGLPEKQEYNLAATLLINEGFDLTGSEGAAVSSPDTYWAGFETDIGEALGARVAANGFIVRAFADGLVVLREPRLDTATYRLPWPMIDSRGATVNSVTLAGAEAAILRTP